MNEQLVTDGLAAILLVVLALPFLSHKVEKQLEAFLFVMGVLAVTVSGRWSLHLVEEALLDPIKITVAVLVAGLVFRMFRSKVGWWASAFARRFGFSLLFFVIVVVLGLISSVITAIIAALILAEITSALRLPRKVEVRLVVIACFSIGLGAVLTPLGEPLATIAVSKLKGEPYNADFFFLLRLLVKWVAPLVLGLGVLSMFVPGKHEVTGPTLTEDRPERTTDILIRAFKVYLFVLALVFLGTGFTPVVDKYLVHLSPYALYWINITSAVLDNATLTAAEITPAMPKATIQMALIGLLIAGGILIPGNIPNIICASKLKITSREWATLGVPLGLALMTGFFIFLLLV
ncbi:MAG: cation transporter [Planctomycetes bacterium RBG_13_60_9]|nr:MAG: cation transporter [Planctomycetes bacterium RBG_13_60_9]